MGGSDVSPHLTPVHNGWYCISLLQFSYLKKTKKKSKKLKGDELSLISCQLENNARMTKHDIS